MGLLAKLRMLKEHINALTDGKLSFYAGKVGERGIIRLIMRFWCGARIYLA